MFDFEFFIYLQFLLNSACKQKLNCAVIEWLNQSSLKSCSYKERKDRNELCLKIQCLNNLISLQVVFLLKDYL